jgi:hypothetical protein
MVFSFAWRFSKPSHMKKIKTLYYSFLAIIGTGGSFVICYAYLGRWLDTGHVSRPIVLALILSGALAVVSVCLIIAVIRGSFRWFTARTRLPLSPSHRSFDD